MDTTNNTEEIVQRLTVPESVILTLLESRRRDYQGVYPGSQFKSAKNQFNRRRAAERLQEILALAHNRPHLRVLELGAGAGFLTLALAAAGFKATGLEPDALSLLAATKLFSANNMRCAVVNGIGERIPFDESAFDIVVSYQTLEHVSDPKKTIAECYRVLVPGGVVHMVTPNYRSFWEGHFDLPWFPFFSKRVAKLYVAVFGRNKEFVDTLNFITPSRLRRWSQLAGFVEVSTGRGLFIRRLLNDPIPEYWSVSGRIQRAVRLFRKLPFSQVVGKSLAALDFHYPTVLRAAKPVLG